MLSRNEHKKEAGVKKGAKKKTTSDSHDADPATRKQGERERKNEALRVALASAFLAPSASDPISGAAPVFDEYGKGSPSDRLQFGYAPAVSAEAIAFHSTISADAWISARRKNYWKAIIKQKPLERSNCEPLTSVLKLKKHWQNTKQFEAEVGGGNDTWRDKADDVLEELVSRQRVA
uniref:Uncharacterized protein n=1 Tax=Trypanosoma vivax (strain Y486) TaxID=1055687 RepID=G0UD36_TRYVY|nr:conserved hypothetical protein [Trypanosoma vivax Y486]